MVKRVLLVASVLFAVVGAVTLPGRVSTAGKVPNHGYPIAGSQCGMVNALSVNTPVATRNARMVCLPNMTGSLSWTREPTKGGRCTVSGQIWGALTCTGEKWSAENKTFCCSFSDATAELRRVLVLVHTSRTTDPTPPSGSTFVTNQYVRSPVDEELRDRLATAGFELSMTNGTYVLKSETETTCVRWIDPNESSYVGNREPQPDAAQIVQCPTSDIAVVYSQLEAIALEAGSLYHSDKNAYIAREKEFSDRITATGDIGFFAVNYWRWGGEDNPKRLFADLTFTVTESGNCMKYVHNNGAPYLDLTLLERNKWCE